MLVHCIIWATLLLSMEAMQLGVRSEAGTTSHPVGDLIAGCPRGCSCLPAEPANCDLYYEDFLRITWSDNITVGTLIVYGGLNSIPKELQFVPGLISLDLSKNSIRAVTYLGLKFPSGLKELSFNENEIGEIHTYALHKLSGLEVLSLSRNKISSWPEDTFKVLKNLKQIDLSYNNIRDVPSDSFQGLDNLQEVRLDHNDIFSIRDGTFSNLPSMRALTLDSNKIWTVNEIVSNELRTLSMLWISGNPFDCSCDIKYFFNFLHAYPEKFENQTSYPIQCHSPLEFRGLRLFDMDKEELPCVVPNITYISESQNIIAKTDLTLKCEVEGHPIALVYWVTPWNKIFVHDSYHSLMENENITRRASQIYTFTVNFEKYTSTISVGKNGDLIFTPFHSIFHGTYTCVVKNSEGSMNATVAVESYSGIPKTKIMSLIIGGICCVFALATGLIVGAIKLCVINFCMCKCIHRSVIKPYVKKDDGIEDTEDGIEESEEPSDTFSDYRGSDDDTFDENSLLKAPLNSPEGRTPRASPMKCPTPNETAKSGNILETLDEVKIRLEKKMEKVRSRYNSMKESGSQYLSSIKDSGSNAANRMKAGVALKMERVKFGVQSMKEFCGTGDMGNQTISVVSMPSDSDDKAEVRQMNTYV